MNKYEDNPKRFTSGQFMKIMMLYRMAIQKRIGEGELHFGQFPILKTIIENPSCTQTFLAKKLNVTQASVALSTKRMQKSGLIDKDQDEVNLRKNRLNITQKGMEIFEKHRKIQEEVNLLAFSEIKQSEIDSLSKTLDKIIANLSDGIDPEMKMIDMMALENKSKKSCCDKNSKK